MTQSPEPVEPLSFTSTPSEDPGGENPKSVSSILQLPEKIVPALNAELGSQLKGPAGTFDVGEVRIRIGKDVFSWGLSG
jgi:U6 snRNA phosphodiesterase